MMRSSDSVAVQDAPVAKRKARLPRLVVVVVLLVALLLFGLEWRNNPPDAFGDTYLGLESLVEVGETYQLRGIVAEPKRSVRIHSIRPLIEGDVKARIAFHLCRFRPEKGMGVGNESLSEVCSDARAVESATVGPNSKWWINLEATLFEPGRIRIRGFEVSFVDGLRVGKETVGSDILLFTEGYAPIR